MSVIKEDFQKTVSTEKEAKKQIESEVDEALSGYRTRVKTELLNRYSQLISAKKEAGKYFFMGQWLEKEEILNLYRFMKRKDRSLIFYLFCLAVILLVMDFSMIITFFPKGEKARLLSFFFGLFK